MDQQQQLADLIRSTRSWVVIIAYIVTAQAALALCFGVYFGVESVRDRHRAAAVADCLRLEGSDAITCLSEFN